MHLKTKPGAIRPKINVYSFVDWHRSTFFGSTGISPELGSTSLRPASAAEEGENPRWTTHSNAERARHKVHN